MENRAQILLNSLARTDKLWTVEAAMETFFEVEETVFEGEETVEVEEAIQVEEAAEVEGTVFEIGDSEVSPEEEGEENLKSI